MNELVENIEFTEDKKEGRMKKHVVDHLSFHKSLFFYAVSV